MTPRVDPFLAVGRSTFRCFKNLQLALRPLAEPPGKASPAGRKSRRGEEHTRPILPLWKGGFPLTLRERFQRVMHYQKPDRLPFFEFGYWAETLPNWHRQGLPEEINDEGRAYEFFGIENWGGFPVNAGLLPAFDYEVVEEDEEYITYRNGDRALMQERKGVIHTIPHYLEFGLKTWDDWAAFKERLDPNDSRRWPQGEDWARAVKAANEADYPVSIGIGSMIGVPRNWIGFQNIGLMSYDDPDLLDDIIETLCVLVCTVIERALREVRFDFGAGWEDICYNSGPILSPRFFDRYVVPRYRRITDLCRLYGVDVSWTDCDGNVVPIIPQFLAGGINCMFPIEVRGGSDPVAMRVQFGRELRLCGGFDKMAYYKGAEGIEAELQRLKPTVDEGAFIPCCDHRVPADVTYESYLWYLKCKRELFEAGAKQPQYDESKLKPPAPGKWLEGS